MLEIRLLGTFDLKSDGKPVTLPSRLAQSLLAYLILNPGVAHRREKLAGLFWPDSSEERGRASLRHELWRIRKALGTYSECLASDDLTVTFDLAPGCHLDTRSLEQLPGDASIPDLIEALSGYRGELLPGFYDDWLVVEREHLQLRFEKSVARLLDVLEAEERWSEMVDWAERWLSMGQNPDGAYRSLMLAYTGLRDRAKVLATYDRCVQALHALGLEPSDEIRTLADFKAPALTLPAPLRVANLPTGTVTFLFTDIEGSTRIAQEHRSTWESLKARHQSILRSAVEAHNGHVFQIVGDAVCAAFNQPGQALHAALKAQRDLQSEPWPDVPIRVRMGIHTGVAELEQKDYRGHLALSSVERIMSAGHGGQILLSQAAVELLEGDIPDEVSLRDLGQHRLKDLLKPQHLFQPVVADLPSEFPPLRTLDLRPHNLPVQLTSFVGRAEEILELGRLLRRSRLVTLTGVGGTGKSRLAVQVAADLLQEFQDGAWLTELASITDPELVPQAIATTLSVKEEPRRALIEVLKDHLRTKSLLLVLDNCEHLIEACAQAVDALLHAAPLLTILATSREALDVAGEYSFHVHSMPLPARSAASAESISQSDAVSLFLDRAAAIQQDFELSDRNAACVAEICTRLDGIPLAIELAAGRARGMTVEQIAMHLDDRFALLTAGSRSSLPRHRTLQAAIDWSHNLLSDPERKLFRRLSVFMGGWTLEAAQDVAALGDLQAADILNLLPELVEKSLISLDAEAGRYHMLETIREYALEKLRVAGEEAAIRTTHLDYFLEEAESSELAAVWGQASEFRLAEDWDNLISAVNWCESAEDGVQKGLRLIGSLRYIWLYFQHHDWGFGLAQEFLARPGAESRNAARCTALLALAVLGRFEGRGSELTWAVQESLSIAREIGDRRREYQSLRWLGDVSSDIGDHGQAHRCLEEALRIARELGHPRAIWAIQSDLAELLRADGDFAGAEALYEQGLQADRQVGASRDVMFSLVNLAAVAVQMGKLGRARERLLELLGGFAAVRFYASGTLQACAGYLAALGDWRHAALLFGADAQQCEVEHTANDPADQHFNDAFSELTRGALGASEYQAAFSEGRQLSGEEALAQAQAWIEAAPATNLPAA